MKPHEFDHHLRSRLGEYQSPIDAQAVWTGVQAKMGAGPNRGGAYWWTTAGLLLLIGAGTLWLSLGQQAAPEQGATAIPGSPIGLSANISTVQLTAEAEVEAEVEAVALAKEANHGPTEAVSTPQVEALAPSSSETQASPPFPEGHNKVNYRDTRPATGPELLPSESTKDDVSAETPKGDNALNSFINNSSKPSTGIIPAHQFPSVAFISRAAETSLMPMPLLPPPTFEPVWGEELMSPLQIDYFPKRATRRHSLVLLADAGVGAAGRQLEATTPLWNDYAEQRRSTEAPLEFVAAQMRMSLQLHTGWYFTAGVSLTQVHERFTIDRTRSEDLLVTYISEIYIGEGGDSTFTYATGLVTNTRKEQYNHINRYTMLDVPLTAGYSHHFGAWSLGMEAGVLVNLGLKSTGSILNHEEVVLRIEDSEMFRSRIGLSYTASINMGYHVSNRTMLYLQPGARYLPGSLTNADIQRQTYVLYGITAGVAYRLW